MDIQRIEDYSYTSEAEVPRLKNLYRRCIFYKEEVCSAPKLRFSICRTCYRIDIRFAVRSLLEKIKSLAIQLFNLPEKPPEQSLLE